MLDDAADATPTTTPPPPPPPAPITTPSSGDPLKKNADGIDPRLTGLLRDPSNGEVITFNEDGENIFKGS
jgi:hypothetical protein